MRGIHHRSIRRALIGKSRPIASARKSRGLQGRHDPYFLENGVVVGKKGLANVEAWKMFPFQQKHFISGARQDCRRATTAGASPNHHSVKLGFYHENHHPQRGRWTQARFRRESGEVFGMWEAGYLPATVMVLGVE